MEVRIAIKVLTGDVLTYHSPGNNLLWFLIYKRVFYHKNDDREELKQTGNDQVRTLSSDEETMLGK